MRRRPSRNPGLIQSDLGRDNPPPVQPNKAPKGWEQRQARSEAMQAAFLNTMQQIAVSIGGVLDLARAPAESDVLATTSRTIGAAGVHEVKLPVPFAALHIANLSTSQLTVTSDAAQSQAPTSGAGVFVVPAGIVRTIAARGTTVSVYGPSGSDFDLTVYSRPRDPSSGVIVQGLSSSQAALAGVLVPANTTTSQSVTLTQISFPRVVVVLDVTAVAGGSVTLTINGITPSGSIYPLLDGLAVTADGVTPYRIGPGLTPSPNAVANDVVPDEIQIVATVAGTITYGIDYVAGT